MEFIVDQIALMKLSRSFSTLFSCVELAIFLDLLDGSDFVDAIVESKPGATIAEVAFRVLSQWQTENGSQATGTKLHGVLKRHMKWEHLASDFESSCACLLAYV